MASCLRQPLELLAKSQRSRPARLAGVAMAGTEWGLTALSRHPCTIVLAIMQ